MSQLAAWTKPTSLRVGLKYFSALLLGFSSLVAIPALAQSSGYPQKPIKLIVPLAAGSAVDNAARIVMQKVATSLGTGIAIENQAGAAGLIGADRVAKSPPRWLHPRWIQRQHHDHAAKPTSQNALGHSKGF